MGHAPQQVDWRRGRSPFKGAILGLVIERPGHGYELAHRLNRRLGPGWSITAADVYPVLNRLERAKLVRPVPEPLGPGQRQARVIYHPTAAAVEEFERWMRARTTQPPLRNELMVKIAVARASDVPHLLTLLDEAERELLALLATGEEEPERPAGSWRGLVADIERYHALAHWRAELEAIVRARERIAAYQAATARR